MRHQDPAYTVDVYQPRGVAREISASRRMATLEDAVQWAETRPERVHVIVRYMEPVEGSTKRNPRDVARWTPDHGWKERDPMRGWVRMEATS